MTVKNYWSFLNGSKLPYIGSEITLVHIENKSGKAEVWFDDGNLYVESNSLCDQASKKAIYDWYRKESLRLIELRTNYFANRMDSEYKRITVKNVKTRWGSCSSKRNLNFNWRLVLMPVSLVDYVIVHELCHLKQMNHSKKFWNEVEMVIPDFRNRHKELQNNAYFVRFMDFI